MYEVYHTAVIWNKPGNEIEILKMMHTNENDPQMVKNGSRNRIVGGRFSCWLLTGGDEQQRKTRKLAVCASAAGEVPRCTRAQVILKHDTGILGNSSDKTAK